LRQPASTWRTWSRWSRRSADCTTDRPAARWTGAGGLVHRRREQATPPTRDRAMTLAAVARTRPDQDRRRSGASI
jgi:hypothetical protein